MKPLERWGKPIGKDVTRGGVVDAVVIGSGAGGSPVALTLARAGYRVVVLEKGPHYDQRDFVYDEIRSCRRDFFVPSTADEPHMRVDPSGRARRTTDGWISNCVGGGTVHFNGWSFRAHPEDLKLRSALGEVRGSSVADWPIEWAELEPYYERVEYEIGVSGDARKNPFETFRRPLPLPPLQGNGIGALIDEACKGLGMHPYPTARAILSRAWNGRSPCRRSFFCGSYGCETGAKSSALAALLPQAVATGKCQVRPLCMATRIETNAAGDRAVAVHYLDANKTKQRLQAAVVVVACSPVESARLFLLSKSNKHAQGLANGSGQVGRNLMFLGKGTGDAEFSRADARIKAIDWREPFVNRALQDFYLIDWKDQKKRRKGGTISWLLPHANPIYTAETAATRGRALPLWGAALKDELRRLGTVRRLAFEIFSETLPVADSRVTLDPEVKDRFGLPVARLSIAQHAVDREVSSVLVDRAIKVLEAMKAKHLHVESRGGQDHVLQSGTLRFGKDPEKSVLDRDCRAHQLPNLFVTDSSFMPTSTGVPPSLTIEANAMRVADRIVALGKQHGLFKR
ncbi:MAG: GMC family oxidoreductase [Myxococcales bacterium]|nr:GMC family oxidoreductase [Myxococcales bacterium]